MQLRQNPYKRAIMSPVNMAHGDHLDNSSVKTVRKEQILLDFDKTQSEINKFST